MSLACIRQPAPPSSSGRRRTRAPGSASATSPAIRA